MRTAPADGDPYVICSGDRKGGNWEFKAMPAGAGIKLKPATAMVETLLWNAMRSGAKVVMEGTDTNGVFVVTDIKAVN